MHAPIIDLINEAKCKFVAKYGFPAERIHVSLLMEGALQRWALTNLQFPASLDERMQGATVQGLDVVRMTKNTPHVEFYLVAQRDGQLYTQHAVVEPETVGVRKKVNENGILIETTQEDYEDGQG